MIALSFISTQFSFRSWGLTVQRAIKAPKRKTKVCKQKKKVLSQKPRNKRKTPLANVDEKLRQHKDTDLIHK